jgi:hypothetical protein
MSISSADMMRRDSENLRGPQIFKFANEFSIQRRGENHQRQGVYAIPVFSDFELGEVVIFFPSASENEGKYESANGGLLLAVKSDMHEVVTGAVESGATETQTLFEEFLDEREMVTEESQFSNGLPSLRVRQLRRNGNKKSLVDFTVSGYILRLTQEQFDAVKATDGVQIIQVAKLGEILADNSLNLRPAAAAAVLAFLAHIENFEDQGIVQNSQGIHEQ